jgi:signal transduction histidine kinase/CheY-like chemotaxis protein
MPKLTFNNKKQIELNDDKWEMLIVDDEEEVHSITKSVLKKLVYENKSLKFHHAYSGKQALEIIKDNPKISLILLDVVMETNEAGLDVVKIVRDEFKNDLVRIILRTGQPGSAPEKDIILNYDINDYKEKTELTSTKLYTSVITALCSYKELNTIQNNERGLEQIIESSKIIYEQQSLDLLIDNIFNQLNNFLNLEDEELSAYQKISFVKYKNNEFEILKDIGANDDYVDLENLFQQVIDLQSNVVNDNYYIGYFEIDEENIYLLYFNNYNKLDETKKSILLIFLSNIAVALKNLFLRDKVIDTLDNQKIQLENRVNSAVDEITKKDKLIQHHSRLAQLGEMISMIAHQWRQPLNAIAANAIGVETKLSIWEDDESMYSKEGQKELYSFVYSKLDNIEKYVQSLSLTIDNFRDFYKPNKEKKLVTINEPIIQALSIVESSMQTKQIKINKEYKSSVELELFSHELMQVILNILKNAQDNFEDKNIQDPTITITTQDTEKGLTISILDNGGGIKEDIINHIFDPYFSTKDVKNGTGLGLYMSKSIIEKHHKGKFYAHNKNSGVCFTMEFHDNLESSS